MAKTAKIVVPDYDISNPDQRKARLVSIETRSRLYMDLYERCVNDGTPIPKDLIPNIHRDTAELAKLRRVDACQDDVLQFAYEYFGEELNPDNANNLIPLGSTAANAPGFHHDLCKILDEVSAKVVNKRVGYAAPRGHAKSAYLSNLFPIHQVLYKLRRYILILSETDGASKKFLEWIGDQLKYNIKLREDFGEFLSPIKQSNDKDNQESFVTNTGVLVESSSMGKQLRGKRNGAYRPDLLVLDDLESSANTNTGELRTKNLDWFNKVVIPIGDPDKTAFVYMGTIVHIDGLLPHVLHRADFESRTYAAIIERPDNEELWEQFEEILRNQDIPDRKIAAYKLYEANKVVMNEGVEVLWRQRWSYAALIEEKVNMGTKAFNSEFMNNPIDPESQIFNSDLFQFFDYDKLHEIKRHLDYYGAWDIALGKNNRSDFNAIVILGRDRRTGVFYVVDAWAKKVPAHKALEIAAEKIIKYSPKIFAVESVAAQYDLYRQLRELLQKKKYFLSKIKPIISRTKKEERIESMEPLFENGAIRFMHHQRLLLEQLEQFPSGMNDDLPDVLQMAVDLCSKGTRRTYRHKPKGL